MLSDLLGTQYFFGYFVLFIFGRIIHFLFRFLTQARGTSYFTMSVELSAT